MTPKEKAKDLVHKYITLTDGWVYGKENWEHKKKCALVAVDEILNQLNVMDGGFSFEKEIEFWQRVKREIEKI